METFSPQIEHTELRSMKEVPSFFDRLEDAVSVNKPEHIIEQEMVTTCWDELENNDVMKSACLATMEDESTNEAGEDCRDSEENPEKKMEPPTVITISCPPGVSKTEFARQAKGQEAGMNELTMNEFIKNRENYKENGRNLTEGGKEQKIAREQAVQDRITENRKQGMSREEAEEEAEVFMKDKAALHDPDQVAGGNPENVTGMGDANVNSSIGAQWKTRVPRLDAVVQEYIDTNKLSIEDCKQIKMNIVIKVVDKDEL